MRWIAFMLSLVAIAAGPTTVPSTDPVPELNYAPPTGWTKVERDRLTIYVAPGAKEGDSTAVVLWPAGRLEGDFAAAFKDHRLEARGGLDLLRAGEVKSTAASGGEETLSVQEILQDAKGRKSLRNYVATRQGARMVVCMFVADTIDGFTSHAKEAEAFMASLRWSGAATRPAPKQT